MSDGQNLFTWRSRKQMLLLRLPCLELNMKIAALILFSVIYLTQPVNGCAAPINIEVGAGPLHRAAADGDLNKVTQLLDNGMDVDVRADRSKSTPLHFATRDGRYDVVKLLVDRGADVNARTAHGDTPLHFASHSRMFTCANPRSREDAHGLGKEYHAIVELLLSKGASADPRNEEGTTPLENAAQCNDVGVAQLLMAQGANINNRGRQYSVLDMAVYWGPEVAKLLIKNGVKVNTVTPYSGGTPLLSAVSRGRFEVTKLLLEHGADVNASNQHDGWTSLHMAYYRCDLAIIKLLLEYHADPNSKDDQGLTPVQRGKRCPSINGTQ